MTNREKVVKAIKENSHNRGFYVEILLERAEHDALLALLEPEGEVVEWNDIDWPVGSDDPPEYHGLISPTGVRLNQNRLAPGTAVWVRIRRPGDDLHPPERKVVAPIERQPFSYSEDNKSVPVGFIDSDLYTEGDTRKPIMLWREREAMDGIPNPVEVYLRPSSTDRDREATIAELHERVRMLTEHNQGNVWLWQGDGEDNLESLTCPILISPKDLLRLTQSKDREAMEKVGNLLVVDETRGGAPRSGKVAVFNTSEARTLCLPEGEYELYAILGKEQGKDES